MNLLIHLFINRANWRVHNRQNPEKSSFKEGRKTMNWKALWHLKLSAAHYHRSTAATHEINIENSFDRKPPQSIMLAELNCISFTNRQKRYCEHIIILGASALGLLLPNISTDYLFHHTTQVSLFKANDSS